MVPILKPGKDAAKAVSYRPIALTTTVICKIMEKLENGGLLRSKVGSVEVGAP